MKKKSLIGAAFAFIMFNACTNDIPEEVQKEQDNAAMECSFIAKSFIRDNGNSRTSITPQNDGATFSWTEGDMVGILPNDGSQVYFTIQNIDSENTDKATFDGGAWGLKSENEYAAYYPFIKDIMLDRTKVPVSYEGQTHKGIITVGQTAIQNLASHDYMAAKSIKQESGNLNFEFEHLGALVEVKVKVPTKGSVNRFYLTASEAIIPARGTFDLTQSTIVINSANEDKVNSLGINIENLETTSDNQEISIFFMMPPMPDVKTNELGVTIFYGDKDIALPLKITTEKILEAGKYYTLETVVDDGQPEVIEINDVHDQNGTNLIYKSLYKLGGTKLKFVSGSSVITEDEVFSDNNGVKAYALRNGEWFEIHTIAQKFKFIGRMSNMFWSRVDELSYFESTFVFGKLTEIDFGNLDTSEVTSMSSMFSSCYSLVSLDLGNFDTSNVILMGGMFANCQNLTSLNLSSFNTSEVRYMGGMFSYCRSLASLDLDNFDTSKVQEMDGMFEECHKLISLDLSSFDTSNVSRMNNMFYQCSSLTSLDLSNFNTIKVNDMSYMFYGCPMESLELSKFDTGSVSNMSYMFANCRNLKSLDLSTFNTRNVFDMISMFEGCWNLESLDLSSFSIDKQNLAHQINCQGMFRYLGNSVYNKDVYIYLNSSFKSYLENIDEFYTQTLGLRGNVKLTVK